jgi:hypothetical protein
MTTAALSRDIRKLAKERNHHVLLLVVDGAQRTPPTSRMVLETPLSPECHEELMALVDRWLAEGKV